MLLGALGVGPQLPAGVVPAFLLPPSPIPSAYASVWPHTGLVSSREVAIGHAASERYSVGAAAGVPHGPEEGFRVFQGRYEVRFGM